jgi:hypothetical protein
MKSVIVALGLLLTLSSGAAAQTNTTQQEAAWNSLLDRTELALRRVHPDVDEKIVLFKEAVKQNPHLGVLFGQQTDPYAFAYAEAVKYQAANRKKMELSGIFRIVYLASEMFGIFVFGRIPLALFRKIGDNTLHILVSYSSFVIFLTMFCGYLTTPPGLSPDFLYAFMQYIPLILIFVVFELFFLWRRKITSRRLLPGTNDVRPDDAIIR